MAEILLIRFATFKVNAQYAIEYDSQNIGFCSSEISLCIAPGIYTSPPNDFLNCNWFLSNNLKLDKATQTKLNFYLTKFPVSKITVI
jgi:hypothetical protein